MEIYKVTNLINGKNYIGQTSITFDKRYNFRGNGAERIFAYLEMRENKANSYNDKLYHNNHLLNAFRKYGVDNFTVEIIDTADNIEELNRKEIHWIKYYDAYKNGYNKCLGGNNTKGWMPTKATRKLWSETRKGVHAGKNNPNYKAKSFTKETLEKMSKARKGKYVGKDSWVARPVINLDTLEIFNTITQAGMKHKTHDSNIIECCKRRARGNHGVRKTAAGYRWMYYDEYLKKGDVVGEVKNQHFKAVRNINTGKIFNTIVEAGKHYSLDPSGIAKACKGKQLTSGGYEWEYYNKE